MNITHLKVENYKGLREAECGMSNFVCVVGQNNAGKSSLLQALLLFVNGTKLSPAEYYDPDQEILITVTLAGVTAEILSSLTDEHRDKLAQYVSGGTLVLARRYATSGSSKLKVVTLVPRDKKYRSEEVGLTFKGKKGAENGKALLERYPSTTTREDAANIKTQKAAKDVVEKYVDSLPPSQLTKDDISLPTGIDNSIRSLLPEPIYIPAVKDLSDDLKTRSGASFGKLISILLDMIAGELGEEAKTFDDLRKKLNRIYQDDGTVVDERLSKVKMIERRIQENLSETFRDVKIELEIPPPEIKTVLSSATIVADDGVRGPVDNKGDGFKRAVAFSILRSYVQLSHDAVWGEDGDSARRQREKFIFLFEEPELYLHPSAQNILFDALVLISSEHQVIVTTHSPFFFSAGETTMFVKIQKKQDEGFSRPASSCSVIDLGDLKEKDKFQLICFESSNLAFFSDRIVLVEGDSELIVLPHIAQLLDSRWDFKSTSTSLIKTSGKGSFRRYANFFRRFGVDVAIVADLDVLVDGFAQLEPSDSARRIRDSLLRDVDAIIKREDDLPKPDVKLLQRELQRGRARQIYDKILCAREVREHDKVVGLLGDLFVFEKTNPRLAVLKDSSKVEIQRRKRELLAELRSCSIYVLEKGAIEAYYPVSVTGSDKPTRAQSLCKEISCTQDARSLGEKIDDCGEYVPEFEAIFRGIFGGAEGR